jgi:hypothetical protein
MKYNEYVFSLGTAGYYLDGSKAALDALNSQIQALEEAKKTLLQGENTPAISEVPTENPSGLKRLARKGMGFLGLIDDEEEADEVLTVKKFTHFLRLTDLEPAK